MADKHDQWAETLSAGHSGWLTGFLAEEGKIDRRMMWRLGSWGVAAVGAVVVAVLASQSQLQLHRDQFAATDLLNHQSQQIQFIAKETQTEAKRLSSAIETLNGDRDRLYARMTSVEQGLDSVTGSIKRQTQPAVVPTTPTPATPVAVEPAPTTAATELPAIPATPLVAAPKTPAVEASPAKSPAAEAVPASTPPASAPLAAWKSMMAPPDTAVAKLSEPAPAAEPTPAAPETTAAIQTVTAEPAPAATEIVATPVARTEFGVDIGGANSVDGLRAIWRGASKSKALTGLRPIMMVKERATGLGMQLRLVAGPLTDAAEAAKICAALTASNRPCETTIFDGQRLALKAEPAADAAPAPAKPAPRKRAAPKHQEHTEQAPPPKPVEEPPPPPKPQSSLSSFLGIR
jgi:outer membrane biosynthesis protein TonB